MAAYKMTPAIRAKISASQKQRFAKAKAKTKAKTKLGANASKIAPISQQQATPRVFAGEYVGERAIADIHAIEERSFRRGLVAGLEMVFEVFIRELR